MTEYGYKFEVSGTRGTCKITVPAEKFSSLCGTLLLIEKTFGPILVGSVQFNTETQVPISFFLVIENLRPDIRRRVADVLAKDGAVNMAVG